MVTSLLCSMNIIFLLSTQPSITFQTQHLSPDEYVESIFSPNIGQPCFVLITRKKKTGVSFPPSSIELYTMRGRGLFDKMILSDLPPETAFIDAGDIDNDGDIDLIATTPDNLVWYKNNNNSEFSSPENILRGESIFGYIKGSGKTAGADSAVRQAELLRDIDSDGRLDIILPDLDKTVIFFQTEDGSFNQDINTVLKIEPYIQSSTSDFSPFLVAIPRSSVDDINGDGLKDLYFLTGSGIRYFIQQPARTFTEQNWFVQTDDPDSTYRAMFVKDLDQDNWFDIIVIITKVEGMSQSSQMNIYFHKDAGYQSNPDIKIPTEHLLTEVNVIDVNGDGLQDLSIPAIKFGLGMLTSAFRGKIKIQNLVYLQKSKGSFDTNFTSTKYTILQEAGVFNQDGDFNGDGRNDLLIASGENELAIHLAGQKTEFSPYVWKTIKAEIYQGANILDLNKDNISDIVIFDSKKKERQVQVIFSNVQ